ncbi:hypothetical protein A0R60_1434 [Enterobacter asburiae]|nr:hypothetical protein A0R60_1434 [Enterobacter asburiae]
MDNSINVLTLIFFLRTMASFILISRNIVHVGQAHIPYRIFSPLSVERQEYLI